MANSMATLSRRLHRSLLSSSKAAQISMPFCTTTKSFSSSEDSLSDEDDRSVSSEADVTPQSQSPPASSQEASGPERQFYDRPLENGLEVGIYKAILVGQVGQPPIMKRLKSGKELTMFSLATGGIRNNRRPLQNEDPREYANRCNVQWHRVSVYQDNLARTILKQLEPGSIVYVEGSLETKIFTDPRTGLVRRIREIALRRNGRVVLLGKGDDDQTASPSEVRGAGYY
ncbi:hypothetical protein Tsubulata_033982 [Turnera subulata]|uniref:Single-stranded DNA-binding protein n=1 Tax=Turnera subulata TaxID=218843 RepID=A0A9Q0FF97_9ROSI|nr:hypothetical protein Tsubulata_033982 [Turnera subulata]